jgi:hypothetical protein
MSFITQPAQQTEKQRADSSGLRLLNVLKQECRTQFELAWKKRVNGKLVNKTAAEVQSFFDAYGVKASQAFDLHALLQSLIYQTDNSWVPLVPIYAYVVNPDGSVTITVPEGE